jgi:hypothetical protein
LLEMRGINVVRRAHVHLDAIEHRCPIHGRA